MTTYPVTPQQDAYTATATREGKWWVIRVDGVGTTQARHLNEVDEWARGLIEAMTDAEVPAETPVAITVRLGDRVDAEVDAARQATRAAEEAQREAAARARRVVNQLLAQNLTQADVATVLGVSRQRVSQLASAS